MTGKQRDLLADLYRGTLFENAEKKPITVKIDEQLKRELINFARNEGIPQVKVLELALIEYTDALKSKDLQLKTKFLPRIKERKKVTFSARITESINAELDLFCKRTLKTKSYMVDNALYWLFYVMGRKIDENKFREPEIPEELLESSNTDDENGEKPNDRAGEAAEKMYTEMETGESGGA